MRSALSITITRVVQDFVDGVKTEAVDFLSTVCHRESILKQLERAVRVYCSLRFRLKKNLVQISIEESQLFFKWESDFAGREVVSITMQDEILRLLCEYTDGKDSAFTGYLDYCFHAKSPSPDVLIRNAELFCMMHYGIAASKGVAAISSVESAQYNGWLDGWQKMWTCPPNTEPQLPHQEAPAQPTRPFASTSMTSAKAEAIVALNALTDVELGEVLDMFLLSNDGEDQGSTGACEGFSIPNFQQFKPKVEFKTFFNPGCYNLPPLPKSMFANNFDPPPWAYVPPPDKPQFEYDSEQGCAVPVTNKVVFRGPDGKDYEIPGAEFECSSGGTWEKVVTVPKPTPEMTASYRSGMDASKDSLPSSTAPKKKYAFKLEDEVYYEGSLFKTKVKARIIDLNKDRPKATILVEGDKCGYVVNLSTLNPVSESGI